MMSSVEFGSRICSDHPQKTCDCAGKSSESVGEPTATRGARHRNVSRSPSNTSWKSKMFCYILNILFENINSFVFESGFTWSWSGFNSSNGCNGVSQCKSCPTFNFFTSRPRNAAGVSHFGAGCSFTDIFDDHGISHSKLQSHANGFPDMFLYYELNENFLKFDFDLIEVKIYVYFWLHFKEEKDSL